MIELVTSVTRLWQRIPKAVLFAVAVLVQCALLVLMVADRMQILREGTEVTLQTQPVDPRDLLRGDYVVLSYDISQVPAGALAGKPADARHPDVFVKLAPNAKGLYEAVSVHAEPVAVTAPQVLIRGRVGSYGGSCGEDRRRFCDKLPIKYGLESYFVPEGEGKKLEDARNQQKLRIVAAVLPSGRAAIKRLLLDGEPVYEEPLY
ncbi:GDYXXLXY domain-containing protein [Bradyrhizobium daqingense]|uniref:Putative membrane-anchored protein n=1 Tax=Bradyrhizobium daqingense TaxID=993502 RepID=A0A562LIE1_9BRAD|nr:GDYXXLXY domain-containing protein [Bradyrhizobium daqingense]TWI07410.1 putative membrane-anchored protein [Bradyrhizobium daqingense]UFS90246.1 GDYXXLXY domain-containing protein [Bradyrhizobium daqingense]